MNGSFGHGVVDSMNATDTDFDDNDKVMYCRYKLHLTMIMKECA
jgi:hypothetical protein